MSGVLIAALVGIGIAVQVRVLGSASPGHHPLSVSLALQLAGVLAGLVWTTVRRDWQTVHAVTGASWWVPLGVGGWLVVAALGAASTRIGVAATLAISIAVQLAVGLGLDARNTAGGAPGTAGLGAALVVVGAALVAST